MKAAICIPPQFWSTNTKEFLSERKVVSNEIAYRWSQEVSAMGKLSQEELEMVYKIGFKPSEYLANK